MDRGDLILRARDALRTRPEVRLALLFGSRARGEARQDSDVDLALLFESGSGDALELAVLLSDALAAQVDVVDLLDPPLPLLQAIIRDAICVYEQRPGEWGRVLSDALFTLENDLPRVQRMQEGFRRAVAERGLGIRDAEAIGGSPRDRTQ